MHFTFKIAELPLKIGFVFFVIILVLFLFLIMLAVANVFYFLGPFVDRIINKNREEKISRLLFNLGFGFSIFLLFLIPIMLVVEYFVE